MATPDQITSLRRLIADTATPFEYSDEDLSARLDAGLSPEAIASTIWREKAASYSDLVDISESGSSRKLSDLRKAALENAAYYDAFEANAVAVLASRPRTRPIVRPTP